MSGARLPKVTFYRTHVPGVGGLWHWRYKASNGKTLADGGESYGRVRDAIRGAELVTGLPIATNLDGFSLAHYARVAVPRGTRDLVDVEVLP